MRWEVFKGSNSPVCFDVDTVIHVEQDPVNPAWIVVLTRDGYRYRLNFGEMGKASGGAKLWTLAMNGGGLINATLLTVYPPGHIQHKEFDRKWTRTYWKD
jgi:hypothetical protein